MTTSEKQIGYVELRVKLFSDKDLKLFISAVDALADEREKAWGRGLMSGISVYRMGKGKPECLCPPCQGREQTWADCDD